MDVSSRSMIRVASSCFGAYEDGYEKLLTATLFDEDTEVEIAELEEVTGGAMTFKVKIGEDALDTEKQLNTIKDMVKATKNAAAYFFLKQVLKDGDKAVQLKAAAAYAQFVKVGTVVTDITQAATIKGAVNAEKKIVLTITPPTGDAGFIKFTTAK